MLNSSDRSVSFNALRPRERVVAAINHRPADRPPLGEICIDKGLVCQYHGVPHAGFAELRDYVGILGQDLICLPPPSIGPEALDVHSYEPPGSPWEDLERWRVESPLFVFTTFKRRVSWGTGALGFRDFMLAVGREEETPGQIFRRAGEVNADLARRAVDLGAQAILLADDIAHSRGLFFPPAFLETCYFPSLCTFLESVSDLGVPVFFHSDGDLRQILPLIVEAGFHGLHCLEQSAGMDLAQVKREFGDRLCLWGNLDPAHLVLERQTDEIEREVGRIMATGAPDGGFIFGTSSGLFEGMRSENLLAAYAKAAGFRQSCSG